MSGVHDKGRSIFAVEWQQDGHFQRVLEFGSANTNINKPSIVLLIINYTNHILFKVSHDDGFPGNLCRACLQKCLDWQSFRSQCHRTYATLKDYLDKLADSRQLTDIVDQTTIVEEVDDDKSFGMLIYDNDNESQYMDEHHSTDGTHIMGAAGDSIMDDVIEDDIMEQHEVDEEHVEETITIEEHNYVESVEERLMPEVKEAGTGKQNLTCELCNKQFRKPNVLEAHMRAHKGEKVRACSKFDQTTKFRVP